MRPGHAVADLGTGSSILALAAARAGARVVYAVERGPVAHVARAVVRDNGLAARVRVLRSDARSTELPERVDVLVSECFGPLAVTGTMVSVLTEASARWLAPSGVTVPARVRVLLAPLRSASIARALRAWERPRYGFDLRAAARWTAHNAYNAVLDPACLCAEPACVFELDPRAQTFDGGFVSTCEFTVDRAGPVHALGGWFEAELAKGVVLRTGPGEPTTVWNQCVLPLRAPLRVRRGERLTVRFEARPAPGAPHVTDLAWSVTDPRGRTLAHDTRWSDPDACPDGPPDA